MEFEAKPIARRLRLLRHSRHEWRGGPVGKFDVRLFVVGIRAVRLPTIAPGSADYLLMTGLAGGLDPDLKVGDVLIETNDRAQSQTPIFHASSVVLSTPRQKAELFSQTRARAVEMESQVVGEWAKRLSIPLICIRAISDAAGDALDPRILSFVDESGSVKARALAVNLLLHPGLVGKLKNLRRNAAVAIENLAEAVHQWILAAPHQGDTRA